MPPIRTIQPIPGISITKRKAPNNACNASLGAYDRCTTLIGSHYDEIVFRLTVNARQTLILTMFQHKKLPGE